MFAKSKKAQLSETKALPAPTEKKESATPGEWACVKIKNMELTMRDELAYLDDEENKISTALKRCQARKAEVEKVIDALTPVQDNLKQFAKPLIKAPSTADNISHMSAAE